MKKQAVTGTGIAIVIASAIGAAACSGSSGTAIAGDGGAASSGGSGSGSSGGSSGSSSGGSSGSSSGGASDGGGSGSGGGDAAPGDDRIDPIALGHAWTYDVTVLGTFALCPAGSHTGSAQSEQTVDGKDAIQVTSLCANEAPTWYAVDGDVVRVDYDAQWILALDAPVQEGHTWSNGTSTFTWHDAGSVTVPAGTFADCWSATQNVTYSAYTIFCRGVGPVRWYSKDANGDGFDAQLTSKNF